MIMVFILKDISYKSFASPGKQDDYGAKGSPLYNYNEFFDKDGKAWSYALARSGTNQSTIINPTGPPGYCLNLYMGLVFDLPKDGWKLFKVEENMDVTPVHHQYYELTHGRKEVLEAKIREGLVKISQSIADLELVKHDLLKYEDFEEQLKNAKKHIDEKADHKEKEKQIEEKRKAEMALKTTFLEEVDFHAGGGGQGGPGRLSMAFLRNHNIMPTVVDDFFRMSSKGDLKKDKMLKDLPEVEKRMLEVKWGAYEDWLNFFEQNVTRRMKALRELEKSREKSLDEYRDWLKPTIARYKLIEDSLESANSRKAMLHGETISGIRINAMAISFHKVKLWFFKNFVPPDPHRAPGEMIEKSDVFALGYWERDNLYLHPDHGLVTDYPWITEKWIFEKAGMKDKWRTKCKIDGLSETEWYYSFQELEMSRTNFKTSATGSEGEDADFKFTNYMFSKNIVAAKYLELKAMEDELEIYIDDMLGLAHKIKGRPIVIFGKTKDGTGYEIDVGHYDKLKKFEFATQYKDEKTKKIEDKKLIGKDFPKETTFASKKDLEKAFPEETFHLIERKKKNKKWETAKELLGLDKIRFFLGSGPYEQNWSERIKKYYLKPNSARFEYVRNFLVSRMGIDA